MQWAMRKMVAKDAEERARTELWWMGLWGVQLFFWIAVAIYHPEPWWATIMMLAACLFLIGSSFRLYRKSKARARRALDPQESRW